MSFQTAFQIYLRDSQRLVSNKTVAVTPLAALEAFDLLVSRTDLDGQELHAVLVREGFTLAQHDFSKPAPPAPGSMPARWWRGRTQNVNLHIRN